MITARKTSAEPKLSRGPMTSPINIAEPITPNTDSSDKMMDAAAGFAPRWPMIWRV